MRFLMKVALPMDEGNKVIKSGKMPEIVQSILAEQKPEAVYLIAENGVRNAYLIINIDNAFQMPAYAEPWRFAFKAAIEFHPVMGPEDLGKAGPAIEQAVKKYGG